MSAVLKIAVLYASAGGGRGSMMVVNNLGQEYGQSFGGVGMSSGGRLSKGVCQVGGLTLC